MVRKPRVNLPPDWEDAAAMAREFQGSCEVIQILVPVPRLIFEDRAYDLGAEVYEQARKAINLQIEAHRERMRGTR